MSHNRVGKIIAVLDVFEQPLERGAGPRRVPGAIGHGGPVVVKGADGDHGVVPGAAAQGTGTRIQGADGHGVGGRVEARVDAPVRQAVGRDGRLGLHGRVRGPRREEVPLRVCELGREGEERGHRLDERVARVTASVDEEDWTTSIRTRGCLEKPVQW